MMTRTKMQVVLELKQYQPYIYLIWMMILLLVVGYSLWSLRSEWRKADGAEFEAVAQSLAGGHGFSFHTEARWLFPEKEEQGFFPTAWVDPIFTYIMAYSFKVFGGNARFILLVMNSLSLILTSVALFFLGRMVFNSWTGLMAGLILPFIPAVSYLTQATLSNAALGGLLVTLSAALILWTLKKVSLWRGLLLGLFLGFSCSIHSALITLIPISMLLILVSDHPVVLERWKVFLIIPMAALAVISPWILRNYLVFNAFVPLRDGFGFNAFIGNPVLVETYTSDFQACPAGSGPAYHASTSWQAAKISEDIAYSRRLYQRAYECIELSKPENYVALNEAQRDKLYMAKTVDFVLKNPIKWLEVSLVKARLFFGGRFSRGIVTLLALVAVLVSFRRYSVRVLALLVLGFAAPFVLALPFYYRYRYPVEPLLVILSSYVLYLLIAFGINMLTRVFSGRRMIGIAQK